MKKLYPVLAIVCFLIHLGNAQTEKGTWLLGGNVNFTSSNGSSQLNLFPTAGYFLLNNVAGGAQFTYSSIKGGGTYWSLGPFGRVYFLGDDKGKLYGTAGLNIGGGTNSKFNTGYQLGAGYAIFLNESIAVDLGMLLNKVGSASKGIFSLGAGFQIHFKS